MRPCDCQDMRQARALQEQGLGFNNDSILVEPNSVVIKEGPVTLRIPMRRFKAYAEWYLEDQPEKKPETVFGGTDLESLGVVKGIRDAAKEQEFRERIASLGGVVCLYGEDFDIVTWNEVKTRLGMDDTSEEV